MIKHFYKVMLLIIFQTSVLTGQKNLFSSDTSVYVHNKYEDLIDEIVVTYYYPTATDRILLNSISTSNERYEEIITKYKRGSYGLLWSNEKLLHPYELFSLKINDIIYDFGFPLSSYIIDLNLVDSIHLVTNNAEAKTWNAIRMNIYFYNDELQVGHIPITFPLDIKEILKYTDKSTRFDIVLQNKFNEKIKAEFYIEK